VSPRCPGERGTRRSIWKREGGCSSSTYGGVTRARSIRCRPAFFQVVMSWQVREGGSRRRQAIYKMERELRTPYVVSSGSRCDHSYYPIMVTPTEAGSYYYARCLSCLTSGPKRSSSWVAYRALKEEVDRLHQGSGSPPTLASK